MTQLRVVFLELIEGHHGIAGSVPGLRRHRAQLISDIVRDLIFRDDIRIIAPDAHADTGNEIRIIRNGVVHMRSRRELSRRPVFKDVAILIQHIERRLRAAIGRHVISQHIIEIT